MDSESSSSQSTAQADNRNVLGQGALQAQGGSTVIQADNRANYQTDNRANYQTDNSTSNSTSVSYALDGEVANRAISSASDNLGASLDFGKSAMRSGYDFSNDAINKSYQFSAQALSSLVQGENRALDQVSQSNGMVRDAYADAKGRGALTDKITIGAIAMAGLVALMALKGKA